MKLTVVEVPSIQKPIQESPGFAKKLLADYKLDIMGLCGFGCRYCSSNSGNYLRINRDKFAALTEEQTGNRTFPADDPGLTFVWPDVIERLGAQLHPKPKAWGAGKTLVFSQLTDAFSPLAVANGVTEAALKLVLDKTSFRIRILTKSAVVASGKWIEFFQRHPGRFVVGLSTGTLNGEWVRQIEVGTSSPTARLKATRALQDAGVPTFGMLCPVFPDVLFNADAIERLIDAVRPDLCEHVWAEPYNDRDNWRAVRAGYSLGSAGANWLTSVYEDGHREQWSRYAADLYRRLLRHAKAGGWTSKLRYLLYEGGVWPHDADEFRGLEGVLLQGPRAEDNGKPTGWARSLTFRLLQRHEGHGTVWAAPATKGQLPTVKP